MIVFAGNGDLDIGRTSFLSPEYFHYGIDKYWDYRQGSQTFLKYKFQPFFRLFQGFQKQFPGYKSAEFKDFTGYV